MGNACRSSLSTRLPHKEADLFYKQFKRSYADLCAASAQQPDPRVTSALLRALRDAVAALHIAKGSSSSGGPHQRSSNGSAASSATPGLSSVEMSAPEFPAPPPRCETGDGACALSLSAVSRDPLDDVDGPMSSPAATPSPQDGCSDLLSVGSTSATASKAVASSSLSSSASSSVSNSSCIVLHVNWNKCTTGLRPLMALADSLHLLPRSFVLFLYMRPSASVGTKISLEDVMSLRTCRSHGSAGPQTARTMLDGVAFLDIGRIENAAAVKVLCEILASSDCLEGLSFTDLEEFPASEPDVIQLFSRLRRLALIKCGLSPLAGAHFLCDVIRSNHMLRTLDISYNHRLTRKDVEQVASSLLEENSSLVRLRWEGIPSIDAAIRAAVSRRIQSQSVCVGLLAYYVDRAVIISQSSKANIPFLKDRQRLAKLPDAGADPRRMDLNILTMFQPDNVEVQTLENLMRMAHADTIGRRPMMEDASRIELQYFDSSSFVLLELFDGHGGRSSSTMSSNMLHTILYDNLRFYEMKTQLHECFFEDGVANALTVSFLDMNDTLRQSGVFDGTTALVVLYHRPTDTMFFANAGDTRAVLVSSRTGLAMRMTVDHVPVLPEETDRIRKMGGFVSPEGRTNGMLAVSRALGDSVLYPIVSAEPHIAIVHNVRRDFSHLIMACDGLWDVLDDQGAADVVLRCRHDPETAARALLHYALNNGSTDNISVLVTEFFM